ncbi:hypothetical protein CesoFtcFv8_012997 [Champsocephalus esox]|uniref:Uncharacterized protein n=1 Tax=Champsocephalus esox TaxID=159716 RepID=A0AAN8BWC1_9TELE|nr:hypothetical protein CesoFtcFv8_012997 [Champsocephalus esox]
MSPAFQAASYPRALPEPPKRLQGPRGWALKSRGWSAAAFPAAAQFLGSLYFRPLGGFHLNPGIRTAAPAPSLRLGLIDSRQRSGRGPTSGPRVVRHSGVRHVKVAVPWGCPKGVYQGYCLYTARGATLDFALAALKEVRPSNQWLPHWVVDTISQAYGASGRPLPSG